MMSSIADFTAVVDAHATRVVSSAGRPPDGDELRKLVLLAVSPLSPPVRADASGSDPADRSPGVAAAEMVRAGLVLVVGRASPVLRGRERQWIAIMCELADLGWRELA